MPVWLVPAILVSGVISFWAYLNIKPPKPPDT
jgi:hypothetical protein